MIRTQISLTPEQMERLRRRARAQGVSIAALVREAVETALGSDGEPGGPHTRALAVVGAFASGARDVSREHDRELADAFAS